MIEKISFQLLCFFLVWMLAYYFGFGSISFCVGCLVLIFSNLGTKKSGELSAYSVFNPGNIKLPGTFDAQQIEENMRGGVSNQNVRESHFEERSEDDVDSFYRPFKSKEANFICDCGSGKKVKKCCRRVPKQVYD